MSPRPKRRLTLCIKIQLTQPSGSAALAAPSVCATRQMQRAGLLPRPRGRRGQALCRLSLPPFREGPALPFRRRGLVAWGMWVSPAPWGCLHSVGSVASLRLRRVMGRPPSLLLPLPVSSWLPRLFSWLHPLSSSWRHPLPSSLLRPPLASCAHPAASSERLPGLSSSLLVRLAA